MANPSLPIKSAEQHAPSTSSHHLFILPALKPRRLDDLTILILADGNRRSSPSGGYAGGARRVVSIAEHLARRRDIAAMVACILSPDNIAKRSDTFFFELYKEFIELGVAIETREALIAARIRMELWGDLDSLRARGGNAVLLADAIEAVTGMTADVASPDLRLILGVGYGPDTARELGVDVVLRTGMEEPGVLRLSGLRTGEGIVNCAITTLWPDVEPRDMDDVIELCKQRASSRLTAGHSLSMVVALIEALSKAELDDPLRLTIPTSAPPAAVAAALHRLYAGPLQGCLTIAVEHTGDEGATSMRYGPLQRAHHELHIVSGSPSKHPRCEGELAAVLAPGQEPPSFMLPDWLPLGSANVHACAATVEGLVTGIRKAQRFAAAHPPLLGSDRGTERAAVLAAPRRVKAPASASDRDEIGDRFADKALQWAAAAGLLLPHAAWQRAAVNYALTAFFIHFRIPTEWDEAGALWEERADLAAKYMLLVSAGDEGIFDRVLDGETPEQRWVRLEASSLFLQGALESEERRPPLPRIPGAELLAAIAGEWQALFDRYQRACHPEAAASFRRGLSDLYAASLAEHHAGFASGLLAERGEDPARERAIEERFAATPPFIAARARALIEGALGGSLPSANELLALLYLAEVASAIGAGLLFRTAALAAPASSVTSRSVHLLGAAATLLDYHFRLSNDASGVLDSPGGDRDPKANTCTLLVSPAATGAMRAAAIVRALATCRRLMASIGGEVGSQIDRVAAAWPSMGTILRRGVFVGRRVYEVGHYTTRSRAEMSAIFEEAEEALARQRDEVGRCQRCGSQLTSGSSLATRGSR